MRTTPMYRTNFAAALLCAMLLAGLLAGCKAPTVTEKADYVESWYEYESSYIDK